MSKTEDYIREPCSK